MSENELVLWPHLTLSECYFDVSQIWVIQDNIKEIIDFSRTWAIDFVIYCLYTCAGNNVSTRKGFLNSLMGKFKLDLAATERVVINKSNATIENLPPNAIRDAAINN